MDQVERGGRAALSRSLSANQLAPDERGSVSVEFAIVMMPFFALIIAVFQITTTFLAQEVLETASEKAVRPLVTGAAQQSGMTQSGFKSLVCSKLPAFMKCANVMVDVRTATSFGAASTAGPVITYDANGNPNNVWTYAPGGGGDITVARIMYIWQAPPGLMGFNLSNMTGGRRLLSATTVFKTEPYQ